MAEFNPQLPDMGTPDFTGASRGTGPNRAFEALFSGLGDTFQNVTNARDAENVRQIEDQVRAGVEETNTEFGYDPPPPGMSDGLDRMKTLQTAMEQGKISETNYYGRLAAQVKSLREQFPRYENVIDQTIMSVTGVRPANAYRDALLRGFKDLQDQASDQQKAWDQWVKQNEGEIAMITGGDYFANPDKYDKDKLRATVAQHKGQREIIDSRKSQLELLKSQGDHNEEEAKRTMSQDFGLIVGTELNRGIGANRADFQEIINQFMAGNNTDLEGTVAVIGQAEGTIRAVLIKRGQEYVTKGLATQDEVNKSIDDAMYPITKAKEAIAGGDFKYAGRFASINKYVTDRNLNRLFEQSPVAQVGAGLNELNQSLGDDFFRANADAISTVAAELAGRAAGGMGNPLGDVIKSGDQKVARATIDTALRVLSDPNVTPDQMSNLVEQFFGTSGTNLMDPKVVSADDLEAVYTKLLSPEVTKSIASKGSAADKEKYTEWALEKFRAIPEFRRIAGDMTDSVEAMKSAKLVYDPSTNRIDIATAESGSAMLQPFGTSAIGNTKVLRRLTGSMNKALAVLDPIAKMNGQKTPELLQGLVQDLVSLEKAPGKGFFSWMSGQLETDVGTGTEGGQADAAYKPIGELTADSGDIDFIDEDEDYDTSSLHQDEDDLDLVAAMRASAKSFDQQPKETRGMAALVSSTKRGYQPDLKNLRPDVTSGLQSLQEKWGRSLPIVSGYRDPARNRRAGGAKKSQHMHGNAVDIDVSGLSRSERIELIRLARQEGWGGIGVYANSLHLDKGGKRSWGPSYKNASLPAWARPYL